METGNNHNLGLPVKMGNAYVKDEESSDLTAMKSALLAHAESRWQEAVLAHQPIEEKLLTSLQSRKGQYSDTKLAEIRSQGGSEVYMQLTGIKVRAAAAWIKNVMFQAGEKIFSITPTPVSDREDMLGQMADQQAMELQQQGANASAEEIKAQIKSEFDKQSKAQCEGMEKTIEDQLIEGGFYEALDLFIDDLCTFEAAFLKGPIVRKKIQNKWIDTGNGWELQKIPQFILVWERVSPFDMFPAPDAKDINDSWLIERHHLSRRDLHGMIGVPSYDDNAINKVLSEYKNGKKDYVSGDQRRKDIETDTRTPRTTGNSIDCYELSDVISGETLLEWDAGRGILPENITGNEEYGVNIWVVGNYVIRVDIEDDPSLERPYYKACYDNTPDSFWGGAIPSIMQDLQNVCNSAARALVNNMAIASAPQTWSYIDKMPVGEDVTAMHPWKHWQFTSDASGGLPMGFFQPNSNAPELMRVYEYYSAKADEYTGIPAFAYGQSDKSGAGATASGLSMLMSSASNGIKAIIGNIDRNVIEKAVKRMYDFNMAHNPDESIKGDAQVVSRGASSLMVKEQQQQKRTDFMNATMNDVDMQILGVKGRAELLRETAKAHDLPNDLVPSEQELQQKQEQMTAMQQPPAQ